MDIGWVSDDNPVLKQIDDAAMRYGVDRNLAHAVAQIESSYNPNAVSPVGAQGVMQLMPATANSLGVRHAFDSAQNIDGGVRLLSSLLRKYGGDTARVLAAYNAGEPAVDRAGGVPNFPETQNYVKKGMAILYPRPAQSAVAPAAASVDDIGWVPDTAPPAAPQPQSPSETGRLATIAAGSSGLGLMSDISGGFRSLMDRMVGNTPLSAPLTAAERKAGAAIGGAAQGVAAEPARVWSELSKSGQAMVNGDPVAAAKHIAFAIPFAGAAGAQMQEYLDRGDVSGALAHGVGAIAPFAAPAAARGAASVGRAVGETAETIGRGVQAAAPDVAKGTLKAGLGAGAASLVPGPVKYIIGAELTRPGLRQIVSGLKAGVAAAREAPAMAAELPVPPEVALTPEVLPNVRGLPAPAMQMPAAPDTSYVRSVPGQYATSEPVPPSRQLPAAPNALVTPLPEDTSFVRAVPAQYPEVEPGFQPAAAAAPAAPALSFDELARSLTGGKSPSKLTVAERANVQNIYDRITKGLSPEEQPPPAAPPVAPAAPQVAPAAPETPAATQEPAAAPGAPEAPQTLQPAASVEKLTDYLLGKKIAPHLVDQYRPGDWQMIADDAGTAVPTADQIAQIKQNVTAKAVETPAQYPDVIPPTLRTNAPAETAALSLRDLMRESGTLPPEPPPTAPEAPAAKASNPFEAYARIAKAERLAKAAAQNGITAEDAHAMITDEANRNLFAKAMHEDSVSPQTMALIENELKKLEPPKRGRGRKQQ
jgi:hypothetical protein